MKDNARYFICGHREETTERSDVKLEKFNDLIALGLTEREAKLYLAMMGKPEWRASELQRITGIQRTHVHRALEVMVSRQYCMKRSEGRYNFYRPTHPKILEEMLTHRWEKELSEKMVCAESVFGTLGKKFDTNAAEDRSLDFIEIVQTPNRIHQRYAELLLGTKKEHLSFNRSPYSFATNGESTKGRDEQVDVNKILKERGVILKSVMMYEKELWPFFEDTVSQLVYDETEEIRMIDHLPIKLGIFDRETAMICVTNISSQHKETINEIIIHDSSFAEACIRLFNTYWNDAVPFKKWEKVKKTK